MRADNVLLSRALKQFLSESEGGDGDGELGESFLIGDALLEEGKEDEV